MKVLHVIPSVSAVHGGPSKAMGLIEQALTAQGIDVETATTDDDGPGRRLPVELGVPLREGGVSRRYFRKQREFYKVSFDFARWVSAHARDYDLLHIHALFSFTSLAAAMAARRSGTPYVVRPLGTLTRYGVTQRRPWLKRASLALLDGPALRHAAAVHFTSDAEAREAAELGIPMKGVVVALGLEAGPVTDAAGFIARFPRLADAPFILFLSRLDPKKNVESLLHAFKACTVEMPELKLVIAGSGDASYVGSLVEMAAMLGIAPGVVWTGHLDGQLKAGALHLARLFVLPSHSENFGIAAAEALAAGLPCVLSHGVALAHDVAAANAGIAVSVEPAEIAAAISAILRDQGVRSAMAGNAARLAKEKYSSQAMGENLKRLYESILAT